MTGFTQATNQAVLDDQLGTTVRTAPTAPMKLRTYTATGTVTAAGTEATGYTAPTITFSAATGANPAVAQNSAAISITYSAGQTITAAEVWDSAGTPVRKAWMPLTTSRTVVAGDSLNFAVAAVQVTLTS